MKKTLMILLCLFLVAGIASAAITEISYSPTVATRNSPAKINQVIKNEFYTQDFGSAVIGIGMLGYIRGSDAVDYLKKNGAVAVDPAPGNEYAIITFYVANYSSYSGSDVPFSFDSSQFNTLSERNLKMPLASYKIKLPTPMEVDVYEETYNIVDLIVQLPINEYGYVSFMNLIWFRIGPTSSPFVSM